ncbi:DHH family phosphoesterase [Natronomonas marina]|jgi:nanoRNase/pAp phosphatase (c-di-AMP/oligoRNAs hydrolase)|uniref:DHH family phosphoesterase n=1 Tax=Natronomonas marina TaxID=2961939 RepID=UPI0020C97C53|nr:DHH family phosphoesterase [Natronomonas marina]
MQNRVADEATAVGSRLLEAALQRPELAAAVVVAALLTLVAGLYLWRRLSRTKGDRFVAALADSDSVSVLMHPNPDPDAMASALAVAALARSVDTGATIQYAGQIRHPENRAFETVLECEFDHIETDIDLAADDVVLVDHNEPRGFAGAEGLDPYAVVDHHPGNGEGQAFTDVRSDRGSCASILTEYLREQGYERAGGETGLPSKLATGLLYGIQADTTSFTRGCTPAEFDAAAFLFPAADADALDRIANPQVDGETLDVKATAIQRRRVDGSFLVSHVGRVDNTDALPTAVEELVRLEGVTAAVVTGERNGTLHASGRSRDDRVHMGKALDAAFESFPEADAGGHARMGGGQIPLPDGGKVALPETAAAEDAPRELEARLFAAMNGEL